MKPFTKTLSVTGYDRTHRIGTVDAALRPRIGQTIFTCPAFFGGDNWWSFSYDPDTHLTFVPTMHTCMKLSGEKPSVFHAGAGALDESFAVEPMPGASGWGALQAFDLQTGKRVWSKETFYPWTDGTLSTAGGLVFSGTPDQNFYALDARTGAVPLELSRALGIHRPAGQLSRRRKAVRRGTKRVRRRDAVLGRHESRADVSSYSPRRHTLCL